jgi:hypothetical protein
MRVQKLFVVPFFLGLLFMFAVSANAQRAEIKIEFNEQFFDALLDAVFQTTGPIEFSLAENRREDTLSPQAIGIGTAFAPPACGRAIRVLRESGNVRTGVRFRENRIVAPLAFAGTYDPPLVGCVDFAGTADTLVDLQFDEANQRLIAYARVTNVSLNGTGGLGGSLVARMVQSSIDKKINPIEIVTLDKMSFVVPIQNKPGIRMKATGIRQVVTGNTLGLFVAYEFVKA